MIAHIAGVPFEELIPSALAAGSAVLAVRGWLWVHVRRERKPEA